MTRAVNNFHLLVVEDNPGDFVLLENLLQMTPLTFSDIIHATSLKETITLTKNQKFDLILLDLSLPDSSGIETFIELNKKASETAIVVLSGFSDMEMMLEAISLGAQDYLMKGEFDEKLLAKTIQYSIERKKNLESLRRSNERYELVNKATLDTIWEWDYEKKAGHFGEGLIKVFGYTEDDLNYDEKWMDQFVHPDDKERVVNGIRFCIASGIENWQDEYRFRCGNGSYKTVYDKGYILYNEAGEPYRMIGAMTDITERQEMILALSVSESRLKEAQKMARIGNWEYDRESGEAFLSDELFEILEITSKEPRKLLNEYLRRIHPDDLLMTQNALHEAIHYLKPFAIEHRINVDGKNQKQIYFTGIPEASNKGKLLKIKGTAQDITERKKLEAQLAEQQMYQQKLITETTIQAQESERNQLAGELHDNVNQILATVKMYLSMAMHKDGTIDKELFKLSRDYVSEAMEEIRKLSHSLATPSLGDIGLPAALEELVTGMNVANKLDINFINEAGEESIGDKHKELVLYRIVQEQMNNILKHAGASHVVITLSKKENYLILRVSDNGRGFDLSKKAKGIGLKNIKSRVEFYAGSMNIHSSPGNGCSLEVVIPFQN